jgi:hypothetical protein
LVERGNHNPKVIGSNPIIINFFLINKYTESSIVWLMYLFWEQEIMSSNLIFPIIKKGK